MFFWTRPKLRDFSYIAPKITAAPFRSEPFRHVYIEDLFEPIDFHALVNDPQIKLKDAHDDNDLINLLHAASFKEISFPGTTTDIRAYLAWHKDRTNSNVLNQDTCEGFGVTMRLQKARKNSIVQQLLRFLASETFWGPLYSKFKIDRSMTRPDFGIQKYLDGYEISPHPDIRSKALTFMVNINPSVQADQLDYHTHYMKFKPERAHVEEFWRANPKIDRCWVPWSWCVTRVQQTKNNSMVIFAPNDDTIHAVKARYDHLHTQRSQIYGNLWFKESHAKPHSWQMLPQTASLSD